MNCPKCRAPMELVRFQNIEIDRCTECKGLWFDGLEREKLRDMKGSEAVDVGDPKVGHRYDDVPGRIHCPRCSTVMIRMVDAEQPHIWFESCSVCGGVHFDAGEFRDWKEHTLADVWRRWFARARS